MDREKLQRYRKLLSEIELLKRQLDRIEPELVMDSVKSSSINFPYIQQKTHIEGYDLETYRRKVSKANRRIIIKMNELIEEKDKLIEFIYSIEDSEVRQIFIYKYMDGLVWKEIAIKMNYSETSIRNKHRRLLNKLKV